MPLDSDLSSILASSTLNDLNQESLLMDELRSISTTVIKEYQRLERSNIDAGGEEGQIIMTEIDDNIMLLLKTIRDVLLFGMKSKAGLFGGGSSKPILLPLLNEISLRSAFQELLLLSKEVDGLFETDPMHLEMAWIIMALNDMVLPQYLKVIRENNTLAKQYYHDYCIILSIERYAELIDSIHDLEQVYFQLDYNSYVNQVNSLKMPPTLKLPETDLKDSSTTIQPLVESHRPIYSPSIGDSKTLNSINDSAPRKASPLKSSISCEDTLLSADNEVTSVQRSVDGEDFATTDTSDAAAGKEDLKESERIENEVLTEEESNRPTLSSESRTTNSLLTTPSSILASPIQEVIDKDEIVHGIETISNASDTSSDLGFFGFKVPDSVKKRAMTVASNLGIISTAQTNGRTVPGDFETIDRTMEKERTRVMCSGTSMELRICPAKGLAMQQFECASCLSIIGINDYPQAKLCMISGNYYCPKCHCDTPSISPALIINNWDFKEVPISKEVHLVVGSQCRTELLNLEALNPHLFDFIDELQKTKKIRTELIKYSDIFLSCESENRNQIVRRIWPREHLIETVHLYTIEDLLEIKSGKFSRQLQGYLRSIEMHVTNYCSTCKQNISNKG